MSRPLTLLVLLASTTIAAQQPRPLKVYVGPQEREGFVDTDRRTHDSIEATRRAVTGQKQQFRLVPTRGDAEIEVLVLAGEMAADSGTSLAVPVGIGTAITKTRRPYIRAVLKVGSYEMGLEGSAGTWSRAAKDLVKDLKAWADQNRTRFPH